MYDIQKILDVAKLKNLRLLIMAVLKSLYAEFISISFLLPSRHLTSFACKNKFAEIDHRTLYK